MFLVTKIPAELAEYSTFKAADTPGVNFASDVIRRNGQFIFVTRDTFSSYTTAHSIPDETKDSIRDGLIHTLHPLSPNPML